MYFGRLTIAVPKEGEKKRVEEILDKLAGTLRQREGCVAQFTLRNDQDTDNVYKVGIWLDKERADNAAQDEEVLAIRSQLLLFTEDHPQEHVLDVTENSGLGAAKHVLS